MLELIDLFNELAEKYKFTDTDKEKVRTMIYSLQENLDADVKASDFVVPREEHPMEDAYGGGLEDGDEE